ncbi:MAG TPA: histidinol-phosphate transaminase [Candidatus Acidoferrum sp.]|nr:histidinol-phosphate transaminase [Candidatus Acidoferrum sp.]
MTRTIEELIPDYIRGLPVYVPGRPIEEVERELKIHAVKLASNENPLGPSPKAVEAAKKALADAHRYPDGGTHVLRETLAARTGLAAEELFVGLGSSEIIDLASRVFLRAGLQGLTSFGSYAPFSVAIRASGAELVLVPQKHFAFDLEAMAKAITPKTGVIYLANPNNPTGTAFGMAEFEEFLGRVPESVLVVLDEAYVHYAPSLNRRKTEEIFRQRANLLILRTFSKVYGLAGMRIGFAIGRPELHSAMNRLKTPFNTSGVAQAAALAAIDDREHVTRCIETNASERKKLSDGLTQLGLHPVPSETNFIFMEVGPEAKEICDELLHLGVIVRPLGWMGFPEAIRISVGTAEENGKCLAAMADVLAKRAGRGELAAR